MKNPLIKLMLDGQEQRAIPLSQAVSIARREVEAFDRVFQKLNAPAGTSLMRIERAAIAAYLVAKLVGQSLLPDQLDEALQEAADS